MRPSGASYDEDRRHAAVAFVAAGRSHSFHGASRHSRRVRILRRWIPVVVGTILAGAAFLTIVKPFNISYTLPADLGKLVVSGSKITMEKPRLSGYTRDSRAYEMTATAAAQDLTKPDTVELKEIRAKMNLQDKSTLEVSALNGLYNSKSELLKLDENVRFRSSSGYEGKLTEALIDIRKGELVSERPVEVKMLQGTLNANRIEVTESGALIRFDGGVAMLLNNLGGTGPRAADASKP